MATMFEGTLLDEFPFYRGKAGAEVHWLLGGTTSAIVTFLDPRAEWDGQNAGDDLDFFRLFGGVTRQDEVRGRFISEVGDKLEGGEAGEILKEIYRQRKGVTIQPPRSAIWQFAVSNSRNGRPLDRSDWLRLAGAESPIAQLREGTVENPIVVRDFAFSNGHRKRIDLGDGRGELVYQNDLSPESTGKGPFPAAVATPTSPTPPTKPPVVPPIVPTEPTDPTPNPPTKPGTTIRTVAVDYRFDKALEFTLFPGTTRVHFDGQLLIAAAVKAETRSPILKVAVGPEPSKGSGRRRFNVGSPVVNASGGRALEWADKTQPVGGGRLPIGQLMPFVFTWTAGTGSVVVWNGRRKETDPLPNLADQGGNVVFGVDPVDDPEADYVPLPKDAAGNPSRLVGTLTIESATGATQPGTGPVDPGPGPVEPLPPPSRLEEAVRAAIALLTKSLEGKS